MKKIFIIGPPGCGKTYLSRIISEKLQIEKFNLDDIYWKKNSNYTEKETLEVRDRNFLEIIKRDQWIIEGSYYKWVSEGLKRSDKIIYLEVSVFVRSYRVFLRYFNRPTYERETLFSLFKMIKWGIIYDYKILPKINLILNSLNKQSIVIRRGKQYIEFLDKL